MKGIDKMSEIKTVEGLIKEIEKQDDGIIKDGKGVEVKDDIKNK